MRRAVALVVAIAAVLAGCSAPAAGLPEGVSASLFETRFDAALRQLQIRVTNDSTAPLQVVSAALDSELYDGYAVFDRAQRVPAGSARDLPISLGEARCDSSGSASSIILEFTTAEGEKANATIDLGSPAVLAAAHERDCLRESVARVATIAPPSAVEWTPGARMPAELSFTVTPTGAPGSLTISSVGNTTLLGLVDAAGHRVTPLMVGLVVDDASAESAIRVRIEPARCDPHAIAEDKQGTHFPFAVETGDGRGGELRVVVSDDVRAEIYRFVTDYCAG